MAVRKNVEKRKTIKKKTSIGHSHRTKYPHVKSKNRRNKKKYRGQGKKR